MPFIFICPSLADDSVALILGSPYVVVSPSLTRPPAPRLLFDDLPDSFGSFSMPAGPMVGIAALPPQFFLSVRAQEFYLSLSEIAYSSSLSVS